MGDSAAAPAGGQTSTTSEPAEEDAGSGGDFVGDDEVLLKWCTPKGGWYEPPEPPTSGNFKLRRGERSLSVWRASRTTEETLRERYSLPPKTVFLSATAGAVRELKSKSDVPLKLRVKSDDPDGDKPGHAGILPPESGKLTGGAANVLKALFNASYVPPG